MKYMLMFCKSAEDDRIAAEMTPQERARLFQAVLDWQAAYKSSFVEQGYRLAPPSTATTVRRRSGRFLVTDGPFVESGEVVGGYSVVEVADLDEAMRIAKAFPACPTVEIRPIIDADQPSPT
jgi:hypothetical protein